MRWHTGLPRSGRVIAFVAVGIVGLLVLGIALIGASIIGGGSLLFSAGQGCLGKAGTTAAGQPPPSGAGRKSIPANYLRIYQQTGHKFNVPWVVLAGIGKVESDHGRSTLPGVRSGSNFAGAAGPMQIGIGGASGNTWGGTPVHPAGETVNGVATDANGDGKASVYEPADAVAGAAKYLLNHGVQSDVSGAIFAYNHLNSYVQSVLFWAGVYARGGFTVTAAVTQNQCPAFTTGNQPPNQSISTVIAYARQQIGKPYLWGGTGPDAFDCSGLVMMAYRAAGIDIPRTADQQWLWGPRVQPGHEQPGDLVFFAGADGTASSPGHVALVIGRGMMVEAYATGFSIRIASYGTPGSPAGDQHPVGFTRPWQHSGVVLAAFNPGLSGRR